LKGIATMRLIPRKDFETMSYAVITGTRFIPLLCRIVLGAAFFFSGWHLCFQEVSFTPEQIQLLDGAPAEGAAAIAVPVAMVQDDNTKKADTSAVKPAEPVQAAASLPIAPLGPLAPKHAKDSVDDGLSRHAAARLTLGLREAGFDGWAEPVAWGVAVAQLLGGALIFVGLLTRLWAFVMVVMLGASFWFITIERAGMFDRNPFEWAADVAAFQEMFFVLAMFVLSFGVLCTGPGMLALDAVLWPGKKSTGSQMPPATK
jgi:uncharacterized membrane protein YphA (DoxX/SURF4 family)